ncbi:NfeD family protein [Aquibaculum arenosum]|uniref:Nodulation protein NfeD n=1 Tax=Aquibaculum arenosum TaxID=3032591 RepID=A0ABT5YM76_9PROT|nr:nodulation protein NfeD [Fodinicurvata sp. CAU 1616]MDF2096034.1 nodulation protein NfeD [Fodinicurvata sp. CAU 1616]
MQPDRPVRLGKRGPRAPLVLLWSLLLLLALLLPALPGVGQEAETADAGRPTSALLLSWDGAIGPASADYLSRSLADARDEGHDLVILRLDTPGGLDSSMRQMIREILASPVPVATWVWPRGARAASAGTYLLYASHVAAMAPGTTLGAATPVRVGASVSLQSDGDSPEPEEEAGEETAEGGSSENAPDAMSAKMVEDAVAYIRGLADLHGRNAEWAEKAVREAASLPATEALAENVVDVIAEDPADLLEQLDSRSVVMERGETRALSTESMTIEEQAPDWRAQLLAIISNPNLALVLMMIGIYGLIFEFSNPGALYPGTVGAISLLLGLFSLTILPIDYAGLGLLLLGVVLMTAEAFVPSFGVLGIGGAVSFALGAAMLFDGADVPGFELSYWTIGAMTGLSLLLLAVVLRLAARSFRRPVVSGREELIGSRGEVRRWKGTHGRVHAHGEIWQARASGPLTPGQKVRITALDGLTLTVEPDTRTGE